MDKAVTDIDSSTAKKTDMSTVDTSSGSFGASLRDALIGVLILFVSILIVLAASPTKLYKITAVTSESISTDSSGLWGSLRVNTDILFASLICALLVVFIAPTCVSHEDSYKYRMGGLIFAVLVFGWIVGLLREGAPRSLNIVYWGFAFFELIGLIAAAFIAYVAAKTKKYAFAAIAACFAVIFLVLAIAYASMAQTVKTGADADEILARVDAIIEQDF